MNSFMGHDALLFASASLSSILIERAEHIHISCVRIFCSASCEASASADVHVFMLSCQDFNTINMQHVPLHEFKA